MNRARLILVAVMIMASCATVSAQSAEGNTFWMGYAPTTLKGSGGSERSFNTMTVGATHGSAISTTDLFCEYGAFAEWTNYNKNSNGTKRSINVVGIKIPVSLAYSLQVADDLSIIPYAGVHARAYALGKYRLKYDGNARSANLFSGDDHWNRLTLGYQLGMRAAFSDYFVGIGYEGGLTELDDDIKFNFIMVTVGLKF